MRHRRVITFTTFAVVLLSGSATAQTSRPAEGDSAEGDPVPLLAGPRVSESQPGEASPFGAAPRDLAERVPPYRWFQLLRHLSDVTDEQRSEIESIMRSFQAASRRFRDSYGLEMREIERARRTAREAGEDLPADLAVRYGEIARETPDPVDAQREIWAVLSETQQEAFRVVLEDERQGKRDRRRLDRAARDVMTDEAPPPEMTSERPTLMQDADPRRPASRPVRPAIDDAATARAERRLRFLRAHQKFRPRGSGPSQVDLVFEFDEENEDD